MANDNATRLTSGASADTLERLISPEQRRKDERKEWLGRMFQWVILIVSLIALALYIWGFFQWYTQPRIRNMTIRDAHVVGESAVCPGDRLIVSYDFHAEGNGLLEVDNSLWAVDPPPRTIIYSASRRFVLAETIDQEILEAWMVPASYTDFATGEETRLAPGAYRRDIAISAPIRGGALATTSVVFTIKPDCEG